VLFDAWRQDFPKLTVVGQGHPLQKIPPLPPNVEIVRGYLSDGELKQLQKQLIEMAKMREEARIYEV